MKLLKFINKNYNSNSKFFKKLEQEQCPILKYKSVYFEVDNFNLETINLMKLIFKNRYLIVNTKDMSFKNLFTNFFVIEKIENFNYQDNLNQNSLFVSSLQILFDKIYYIDFYKNLNLKNFMID